MIPLSFFLIAWLILLGIYAILTLVSVIQMVRFGVSGAMTYLSTAVFLAVVFLVVGTTGLYLMTVDWSLALDLSGLFGTPYLLTP